MAGGQFPGIKKPAFQRVFCFSETDLSPRTQWVFFEVDCPALLKPLVLCSPGVEAEIALALEMPRVSLEWAMPEVVVP
ncbi:hypothetical protein D3C85_1480350 [compost metagenome]